jgi:hypothetical protein
MGDLVAWAFELAGGKLAGVLPRWWAHVQGVSRRARVVAPLFSVTTASYWLARRCCMTLGTRPNWSALAFTRSMVPGACGVLVVLSGW